MKKNLKKYAHLLAMATVVAVLSIVPLTRKVFNVVDMEPEQLLSEGEYIISPYDKIFRRVCRRHNVDWVLMSAIAFGE